MQRLKGNISFEIIIVEDGSQITCKDEIDYFKSNLDVQYIFKENSGPGESRNVGKKSAKGDYFIVLDSDVILPPNYLLEVNNALKNNYTDAFGGRDAAHNSFTTLQKAINFSMTSFITTGGLRTNKGTSKFQLRSFNLGLSKKTYELTNGFSSQRIGEDIHLTHKIWENKLSTQFIEGAFVFHKRRTSLKQFYKQVFNFGAARPILNKQFKGTSKLTYWFPSLFSLGFLFAFILLFVTPIFLLMYLIYFGFHFLFSLISTKSIVVSLRALQTSMTQFFGYGLGFLRSQFRLHILNYSLQKTFPKMFS
jgi:glycosyltransferase involved in cell wall biosynthesis